MAVEAASDSFVYFWDPFPSTGLHGPALIRGYMSSLTVTCYAIRLISQRGLLFCNGKWRRSGSGGEGLGGVEGEETEVRM